MYGLDNNDALIHQYKFPATQFRPGTSLFITPVVDVRDPPPNGQCGNTRVYIADVTGYGILVYDVQQNRSWRVQNKLVFAHPPYGTFTLAGETFDLMDGILGMALSPRTQSRGKTFGYFAPYNHIHCTFHPVLCCVVYHFIHECIKRFAIVTDAIYFNIFNFQIHIKAIERFSSMHWPV